MSKPVGALWSSPFAVYLGTAGASVGLGSIWRFPYLAGTGGGSAFILVFVFACVLIAMPLLVAEFALGRRSRQSPPEAAGAVATAAGLSSRWNVIGIMGSWAAFLIFSYYTLIAGCVLAFAWKSAAGDLTAAGPEHVASIWQNFRSNPLELGAWYAAFVLLTVFISARGLQRGIETANKFRAVGLLVLLLILVGYSLSTGDVRHGLEFAFAPHFSAITAQVVLSAIGQAFYATGVGQAMMIAYGAYVEPGTSLVRTSFVITASILFVSLLAALMPSVALLEPGAAWLTRRRGISRTSAVWITAGSSWVLGLGSVLSLNRWSAWYPLNFVPALSGKTFFEVVDYVTSNIMLPIGALLTSVFVGWRLSAAFASAELTETTPFARSACVWLLRYVCPLAILAIFVATWF